MSPEHRYAVSTTWTGDRGTGTSGYRDYSRDVTVQITGKPDLLVSSDRPFRGDPSRHNPEDLLLAALSECHLLAYLHACVTAGVVVTGYHDEATAVMVQEGEGGRFREAVLRPRVEIADETMRVAATEAHDTAHRWCFIANSVNFPVRHEATIVVRVAP